MLLKAFCQCHCRKITRSATWWLYWWMKGRKRLPIWNVGVKAEVIASTFDEPAEKHVKVSTMALQKAKRLVECGHDVVILLDSITRLARAHNTIAPSSGKVLSGGVEANAMQKPKQFFGAAVKLKTEVPLTIIATALVDTGSKMDEVIFEEFKGTGNMELQLDRKLSNRRIYPAIDIVSSSTRRDDLLLDKDTLGRMWVLRKHMADMNRKKHWTPFQKHERNKRQCRILLPAWMVNSIHTDLLNRWVFSGFLWLIASFKKKTIFLNTNVDRLKKAPRSSYYYFCYQPYRWRKRLPKIFRCVERRILCWLTKKTWPFELTVSEDNGKLSGYSRIAFEEDGVKHVVFRDHKIKIQDDKIIIEDVSELSKLQVSINPKRLKKTMTLTLNIVDSFTGAPKEPGPPTKQNISWWQQAQPTGKEKITEETEIFKSLMNWRLRKTFFQYRTRSALGIEQGCTEWCCSCWSS